MLFATNQTPKEGKKTLINRNVSFRRKNTKVSQHMFFL